MCYHMYIHVFLLFSFPEHFQHIRLNAPLDGSSVLLVHSLCLVHLNLLPSEETHLKELVKTVKSALK